MPNQCNKVALGTTKGLCMWYWYKAVKNVVSDLRQRASSGQVAGSWLRFGGAVAETVRVMLWSLCSSALGLG